MAKKAEKKNPFDMLEGNQTPPPADPPTGSPEGKKTPTVESKGEPPIDSSEWQQSSTAESQDDTQEDPSAKVQTNPIPQEPAKSQLTQKGQPRKSNAGRKAVKNRKEWHTTNIDLRREFYDVFCANKLAMGGTLSNYINKLIREDLDKNKAHYEELTSGIRF